MIKWGLVFSLCLVSYSHMAFANNIDKACPIQGKLQVVDSFPDIKVQVVDSFPDVKIQFVTAFPGLN